MPLPCEPEQFRPLLRLQACQFRLHPDLRRRLDESDLVQETLTRAHERRDQFRGTTEAELIRWLKEILTHVTIDTIRRERSERRDPACEVGLESRITDSSLRWDMILPDQGESPEIIAQKRERLDALATALEQLPEDQRDAVVAKDLLGKPIREVADQMEKTEQAIAGLLRRGRRRLREILIAHDEVPSHGE